MLDAEHPMYKLANMIDWNMFEQSFAPLYCKNNGRAAKPIRLMVGLLILKHLRNISGQFMQAQWAAQSLTKTRVADIEDEKIRH